MATRKTPAKKTPVKKAIAPKKSRVAQKTGKSGAPKSAKAKKAAPATAPASVGAPSIYTEELAETICQRLADGESLVKICLDAAMPHRATVMRWLSENEVFRDRYVRAREAQADFYAAQVVEIADRVLPAVRKTVRPGSKSGGKETPETTEEVHVDAVDRSRLMVDARKWYAAKLAPKKYGDTLKLGGDDGLPPIQHKVDATISPADAYKAILG